MKPFPTVSETFLSALEERFPDKAPRAAAITPVETGVLIGQQKVLDFLRNELTKQTLKGSRE